jgi:hypothetical protein
MLKEKEHQKASGMARTTDTHLRWHQRRKSRFLVETHPPGQSHRSSSLSLKSLTLLWKRFNSQWMA